METPPSDPADHAQDFARRYAEPMDYHAAQIMLDLGIPLEKIGTLDPVQEYKHAAFHPTESSGGSVTPDGRITLDSGVMNLDGMEKPYREEARKVWAASRLKDKMEAVIAHEQ